MSDNIPNDKARLGTVQGILLAVSPLPWLFVSYELPSASWPLPLWVHMLSAALASLSLLLGALSIIKHADLSNTAILASCVFLGLATATTLQNHPVAVLVTLLFYASVIFAVHELRSQRFFKSGTLAAIRHKRSIGIGIVLFAAMLLFVLSSQSLTPVEERVLMAIYLIAVTVRIIGAIQNKKDRLRQIVLSVWGVAALSFLVCIHLQFPKNYGNTLFLTVMPLLAIVPHLLYAGRLFVSKDSANAWVNMITDNPKLMLPASFLMLILLGTLFLCLPISTPDGISSINALFTATSAVSMTGLTIVETSTSFTQFGKSVILVLSQLGALGIMTISPVIAMLFGQRLSMQQTRSLNVMIEANNNEDILKSLSLIIKFTFIFEAAGALLLTLFMLPCSPSVGAAIKDGIFTSVASFCNAGFSLHSENMAVYMGNPAILFITSVLILFGGLSPLACMFIPMWLRRRPIPPFPKMVLNTSALLVLCGFALFLCFEWNGLLAPLSLGDKISNAWFQVVSARTGGMNSLDISKLSSPATMLFILLMVIGGSPSSTGGGLKTTLFAILTMTALQSIAGNQNIIIRNRRIHPGVIHRVITLLMIYCGMLFTTILMLTLTQNIPTKALIFEAVSALSTIGLSMGATQHLDVIGKVIVILAMYAGRVSATAIIMLISYNYESTGKITYPDIHIPLT